MHIVVHVVAVDCLSERSSHASPVKADVDPGCRRSSEESVEVAIEEREDVVVQPDAFPDAVADQKTAIEHRDLGFVTGEEFAVDVDLDGGITFVGDRLMSTFRHPQTLARRQRRDAITNRNHGLSLIKHRSCRERTVRLPAESYHWLHGGDR